MVRVQAGQSRVAARLARAMMMVSSLAAALTLLAVAPATSYAAPRPPGGNFHDPVVRAVDIAAPAVVRVGTLENATISIELCTRSVTLPLSGSAYQIGVTGSGAFISANGDVLTADHVVDIPDDVVVEFAAQDIANLLNNPSAVDPGCHNAGAPVSASDVASGAVNFSFTTHRSDVQNIVWMSTAFTGPTTYSKIKDVPRLQAKAVVTSSFTENDLAVVHVNMTDTPSVRLDDSSAVAVEDHLTVVGFPGNGDVNDNPSNFLTPSVNEVQVSAIKTGDNGIQLIQVGGNVEHGDSGGPVLDADGHIVGVVSFGGPDPRGTTSFLRTSNAARDLITSQGLNLEPGNFQQAWQKAFDDYAATYVGHWQAAAREMTQLASNYPSFAALGPYLDYAKSAAIEERNQMAQNQPSGLASLPGWALIAAGVVAVLLCAGVGVGVWLLVRRQRKRAVPAPAAAYPYGYAPYPGFAAPPTYPLPAGSYPAAPPTYPLPGGSYPPAPGGTGGYGPLVGYPGVYPVTGAMTAPGALGSGSAANWPGVPGSTGSGAETAPESGASAVATVPAAVGEVAPPAGQSSAAMVLCANGHWFSAHEARCPWCGAAAVQLPSAGSGATGTFEG